MREPSFGKPLDYDAGLAFNYNVWTPGTRVVLTQVNWDSAYRDVVKFTNKAARNNYLNNQAYKETVEQVTYLRQGAPVRLSIPYARAMQYNYMMVENPAQPIAGDQPTKFFYFIRSVRHAAPDTTEFVLQLDVWQTYIYDCTVNRGMLERGHLAAVLTENNATPTTPARTINWALSSEGLDAGNRYVSHGVPAYTPELTMYNSSYLITSTISLVRDPGTKGNPNNPNAISSFLYGQRFPTETYLIRTAGDLSNYLTQMAAWPWISQGIFRIVAIPSVDASKVTPVQRETIGSNTQYPPGQGSGVNSYLNVLNADGAQPSNIYPIADWVGLDEDISNAYVREAGDSPYLWMHKFHTFPFCYLSLTDGVGNELALNPEYVRSDTLDLTAIAAFAPGSEMVRILVNNYMAGNFTHEYSLTIGNLPTLPALNDNAAIAAASSAHSRQQARASASWAQDKNLRSNATSYDNATIGLDAASDSAMVSRNQDIEQTALGNETAWKNLVPGAVSSVAGGAAGGAVGGPGGIAIGAGMGAASALTSVWNTSNATHANTQALGIRNQAAVDQANIAYGAGAGMRDNNKSLADWAAKGDYANEIAGQLAKYQDLEMTPPSMSGQYGGEVATWAMGNWTGVQSPYRLTGRIKTITRDVINRIGEFWARYGYQLNRYVNVGDLMLMTELTYWQLRDVHISATPGMSEEYLDALRGIFEKGVTIYDDPAKIGRYNLPGNRIK